MFLFFQKGVWFAPFFLLIPFSLFLSMKGVDAIIKGRSMLAAYFVVPVTIVALAVAAFYVVFRGSLIPYWFLNFSLPFGAVAFPILEEYSENSVWWRAFAFFIGVFCNATAIGCLISFAEKLYRMNKELDKLDG